MKFYEDPMRRSHKGSYVSVCPTIWSRGWGIRIWSIVEDEVVLDAVSGIINANKVKADSDRSSSRCSDGPFAVSVVWVCVRIAGAGKGALVPIERSTTARG